MTAPAVTWRIPRESEEWVGPIVVTSTADGQPVEVGVKFAVLPEHTHPTGDDDWTDPTVEPGGTALGVWAAPGAGYSRWGIWARVDDNPEHPVLAPAEVGWILRT